MADLRHRRAVVVAVAASLTLSACGGNSSGTTEESRAGLRAAAERLPGDYQYLLTSTCGERGLIGTFRIVVRGGVVTSGAAADAETYPDLPLETYPTIQTLLTAAATCSTTSGRPRRPPRRADPRGARVPARVTPWGDRRPGVAPPEDLHQAGRDVAPGAPGTLTAS